LVDGPNQYSGRVEVYNSNYYHSYLPFEYKVTEHGSFYVIHHGAYRPWPIYPQQWGTICDEKWTVEEATVVCRSLGYNFNKVDIKVNESYGVGTGPIWTNYISCLGRESYIWDCSHNLKSYGHGNYGLKPCNHSTDRGITCSGILSILLPHNHITRYILQCIGIKNIATYTVSIKYSKGKFYCPIEIKNN